MSLQWSSCLERGWTGQDVLWLCSSVSREDLSVLTSATISSGMHSFLFNVRVFFIHLSYFRVQRVDGLDKNIKGIQLKRMVDRIRRFQVCAVYNFIYVKYLSTVLYFSFRFWTVKYLQHWTNIWKPLTVKQRTCQWSMWGASSHQFIRYCLSLVVTSHDILDLVVIEEDRSAVVDFDLLRFKKLHVFYCCLGCLIKINICFEYFPDYKSRS